jgi:acylphosphatase
MSERRRIVFSGRVQGVGFRMTAVHLAAGLPLSGTVQNLPDGDVELIAEGSAADIDTLIDRLREHFEGLIRTVSQDRSTPTVPHPGTARGIRVIH